MSILPPQRQASSQLGPAAPHPNIQQTRRLAALARRIGGLHLSPEKTDFFYQRLNKRLAKTGKRDFQAYCNYLESDAGATENRAFIEALTTHTTYFFRENKHFEWLEQKGWADLVDGGAGRQWPLRIWSAACSNGAELYSALMSFAEFDQRQALHARFEGFGTDLSHAILNTAARAIYSKNEIKDISEARRRRFLLRARDASDRYRITPELRRLTKWQQLNLTNVQNAGPSLNDLILLRNVLIYFDAPTRAQVVENLCKRLREGGVLLTGHSETLPELPANMVQVTASIYQKRR